MYYNVNIHVYIGTQKEREGKWTILQCFPRRGFRKF